ncbi:MAG: hypothetical protein E7307_08020 [Butyrivibrio sp.]|nr:hypothetical protein [Butyrivibrio sp.]
MDPRKEIQESLKYSKQKLDIIEDDLHLEDITKQQAEEINNVKTVPLQKTVKELLDEEQDKETLKLDKFTEVELGEKYDFVTADYKKTDPAFSKLARRRPALSSLQVESGRSILGERTLELTYRNIGRSFFGNNGQLKKLKETDDPDRSPFFKRLCESLETLKSVLENKRSSTDDIVSAVLLVSEYANAYYDTHRGHIFSEKGQTRKQAAVEIRDSMKGLFENLLSAMNIKIPGDTRVHVINNPTKKEKKRIDDSIEHLGDAYEKWGLTLGKDEIIDERAHVREKLNLLLPYEGDIARYKIIHQGEKMPYVIMQYDLLRRQVALIDGLEKGKKAKVDDITKMTLDQIRSMDEKKKEKELSADEIDQGLTQSQLDAIDRIDQWFVRNAHNGGMLGSVARRLKNNHSDIINELFRKSKRERLFIYYLIEAGLRKVPSTLAVWQSQSYIPNLDTFRDRMKATKLKVTSWASGAYTYMSKLSDALRANEEYKEMIKDGRDIAVESKEEREAFDELSRLDKDKLTGEEKLAVADFTRKMLLKKTYGLLNDIQSEQIRALSTKGKEEKEMIDRRLDFLKGEASNAIKKLIAADNEVGKIAGEYNFSPDRELNPVSVGEDREGFENLRQVPKAVGDALGKMSCLQWGLDGSQLAKMDIVTASGVGSLTGTLGQASAMLMAVNNLIMNGSNLHVADYAQQIVTAINSFAGGVQSAWNGIEKGRFLAEQASNFTETAKYTGSSALQVTGIVTSGVATALNAYSTVSSALDHRNAVKASKYLAAKHRDDPESKETRYEKNMMVLAERLSSNKAKSAAIGTVSSVVSLVSVVVPGIGLFTAPVGIGLTLIGLIRNKKRMVEIRTQTFDDYFGFGDFYTRVENKMAEMGRRIHDPEAFKDQLRRKLCAAAGYADMFTAMDAIAVKYAELIHNKLFVTKDFADKDEREGYIQIIKSFGLPFNEKKGKPDKKILARRMTGR